MFWVPVIAAVAGAKMIMDCNEADKNTNYAKKMTLKNLNRMEDAKKNVLEQQEKTRLAVERFANRKRGILQTSIKDFIQIYTNLMTINFVESDAIKELSDGGNVQKNLNVLKQVTAAVGNMDTSGMEMIAGMLSSGGGLLCAGALAGVTVGSVTAGVAGAMLNTAFLPATFCMAVTGSIVKDSETEIQMAQMRKKYTNVVVAQAETNIEVLMAISERARRLTDLLTKLNMLFIRSVKATEGIIEKNGKDRSLYTEQDKDYIRNCLNFADAIKSILDTPLFESDGKIAEVSKIALEAGENYLQRMEQVIIA